MIAALYHKADCFTSVKSLRLGLLSEENHTWGALRVNSAMSISHHERVYLNYCSNTTFVELVIYKPVYTFKDRNLVLRR